MVSLGRPLAARGVGVVQEMRQAAGDLQVLGIAVGAQALVALLPVLGQQRGLVQGGGSGFTGWRHGVMAVGMGRRGPNMLASAPGPGCRLRVKAARLAGAGCDARSTRRICAWQQARTRRQASATWCWPSIGGDASIGGPEQSGLTLD